MIEKSRLFRSLLLEPLECRSVFSVDGMVAWQDPHPASNYDFDQFQPAQYDPHGEVVVLFVDQQRLAIQNRNPDHWNLDHWDDRQREMVGERSAAHGHSLHHGRDDDSPLPPAEGEGPSFDTHPIGSDKAPSQIPTQRPPDTVVGSISLPRAATPPSQLPDVPLGNIPRVQLDAGNFSNVINPPGSIASANSSPERQPGRQSNSVSVLQNSPAGISVVSLGNTAAQVNLAGSSALASSALATGTTTFDFSSRLGIVSERPVATSLSGRAADDFHFTKPQSIPDRDSIVDQALVERVAGSKSPENLLSDLAENHRRGRVQNRFDAERPDPSGEPNWRPGNAAPVEIAFAGGGMIALALNRDIGLRDLEEISEAARDESKAWIANVGIYRAFENGAIAASEYSGLTDRMTRSGVSSLTTTESPEVEGDVANSHLQELLASTTAAVGAVMFGLRRMRKFTPLMFTTRKR